MIDPLAVPELPKDSNFFFPPVLRDNQGDVLPRSFCSGVAEYPLCSFVPAGDNSIQILADDGIVGRIHNGSQQGGRLTGEFVRVFKRRFELFSLADVLDHGNKMLQLSVSVAHCGYGQIDPDR